MVNWQRRRVDPRRHLLPEVSKSIGFLGLECDDLNNFSGKISEEISALRARLHGEFHPGLKFQLKFQTGFWNKSSENQVVDYMERDSARGAIQPGLKILARYSQTGLGFSARPNGLKNPCSRCHFFSPGWKRSASMHIYCVFAPQ